MSDIFRLDGVSKTFERNGEVTNALDDVSLGIPAGSFYGIVGTSGAGKSTLLRLLNLLERPTSGTVTFKGTSLAEMKGAEERKYLSKVATIFQHFNLFHGKTVLENVAFPLAIRGVSRTQRITRAKEVIKLVGLEGKEKAYPSQLSGGQKQRVGIARALADDTEVLLCDEATSALDSETTKVILDLLIDLKDRLGLTIVLITHAWDVVRYACDRATLVQHGKIVESGAIVELIKDPNSYLGRQLVPAPEFGVKTDDRAVRYDLIFESAIEQTIALSEIAQKYAVSIAIASGGVEQVAGKEAARFKIDIVFPEDDETVRLQVEHYLRSHSIVIGGVS